MANITGVAMEHDNGDRGALGVNHICRFEKEGREGFPVRGWDGELFCRGESVVWEVFRTGNLGAGIEWDVAGINDFTATCKWRF